MLAYLVVAMVSVAFGLILGGILSAGKVSELDEQLQIALREIENLEHRAAERALYEEPRIRLLA